MEILKTALVVTFTGFALAYLNGERREEHVEISKVIDYIRDASQQNTVSILL
jgi:hypothetical protein